MHNGVRFNSKFCSEFVECYWVYEGITRQSIETRILPDGLVSLVFYFKRQNQNASLNADDLRHIFVSGEITKPGYVRFYSGDLFIVAKIRPFYLHSLLHIRMREITDRIAALDEIDKRLFKRLSSIDPDSSLAQKLYKIDKELFLFFHDRRTLPAGLREVFDLIFSSGGICTLDEIVKRSCMSVRSLERSFNRVVGLPPKTFLRIIRFDHTIHQLKLSRDRSLIQTALDFGYYDQAHFNNEIKKLSGYAPTYFLQMQPR
jgi:AraC-like DNA-binding protein